MLTAHGLMASSLLRSGMGNSFLFAAYALVWIIFMVYAWNISRRQAQLRKDLEELKRSRQSTVRS